METAAAIPCDLQVRFTFNVHFTEGVFLPGNPLLRELLSGAAGNLQEKVLVVVEEVLLHAMPQLSGQISDYFAAIPNLNLPIQPIIMAGGERVKNSTAGVKKVHEAISEGGLSRHSFVLAIGGGALLDVVGFAAATAHRGVRHIRLPTTTLSQADGGVGVKNGINAFGKKNFIGAFAPPVAVINDCEFLQWLPARRKAEGYAEAVKVALIRDAQFFEEIERLTDELNLFQPTAMRDVVHRSAKLHVQHISTGGDPFEQGSTRPLDFGHWAAHKLEQLSEFQISHGEAVAIGVALDVIYSRDAGYLPGHQAEQILALLQKLRFTLFTEELLLCDSRGELAILVGLDEFREHLGGELTVTLLRGIGEAFEVHEIDRAGVLSAIHELRARTARPAHA